MTLNEVNFSRPATLDCRPAPHNTQMIQYSLAVCLNEVLNAIATGLNQKEFTQATVREIIPMQLAFAPAYPLNDPRVHYLDSYSLWDNTIQLHDGSLWKVNAWDMYKIRDWASNDVLSLSCTEFLYGEKYQIANSVTGQSVLVNLVDGPVLFGPNTHWVASIDHYAHRIYLENGTCWNVRYWDQNKLSEWAVNDTVILGDATGWWNDVLLINVNMNQHAYGSKEF